MKKSSFFEDRKNITKKKVKCFSQIIQIKNVEQLGKITKKKLLKLRNIISYTQDFKTNENVIRMNHKERIKNT